MDKNKVFRIAGIVGIFLLILFAVTTLTDDTRSFREVDTSVAIAQLDAGNVDLAAQIASVPEHIRGYGHVKEAHLAKARAREAELLREWDNPLRILQVA